MKHRLAYCVPEIVCTGPGQCPKPKKPRSSGPDLLGILNGVPHGTPLSTRSPDHMMNRFLEALPGPGEEVWWHILRPCAAQQFRQNDQMFRQAETGVPCSAEGDPRPELQEDSMFHGHPGRGPREGGQALVLVLEDITAFRRSTARRSSVRPRASGHIRRCRRSCTLPVLAHTDSSVLIGETGTGKDIRRGYPPGLRRRGKYPFIKVNGGRFRRACSNRAVRPCAGSLRRTPTSTVCSSLPRAAPYLPR